MRDKRITYLVTPYRPSGLSSSPRCIHPGVFSTLLVCTRKKVLQTQDQLESVFMYVTHKWFQLV